MARNRFYLFMSTLYFAVVLIGFSRSFYLKSYFDFPTLPVHLYLHGIALTSWFSLALLQPWLIRNRQAGLHRRLGVIGAALAVSVVLTGLWTVALRDAPEIDQYPTRAAGNLASLLMFLSCVSFGLFFRKNPETHKRLMLLGSIPILAPALDRLARIPVMNEFWGKILYWFPAPPEVAFAVLSFLFLLLLVVANDLISQRRVHKGTVIGLLSIFVVAPAMTFLLVSSGFWIRMVHWIA
jgi:hypothetical protein